MNLIIPLVVANPDPHLILGKHLNESNTTADTTTTFTGTSSQTKIYLYLILGTHLYESNTTIITISNGTS